MKKQTIIDVFPINRNGEIVYVATDLGAITQAQVVTVGTNVQNIASAAAAAVPTKPITAQTDFSKGANAVATGAATVAAVAAVVPGIGTVVAVVAGVVAAAAALLGKIFANSKAKAYEAERGQWENVNAQIKYENQQLDSQYDVTRRAIDELKASVSSLSGMPMQSSTGLGLCLSNCKEEKAKLQSAKDEYAVLVREQENKTKLMASLLDEYNKLIKGILELKSNQGTKNLLLWIFVGAAALGTGYMIYRSTKK